MEELEQAKLKSLLEAKKTELEESIANLTEAHPTPASSLEIHDGADREDVTTDFIEMQDEQSIMANQQALWTLVDNALKRMEKGTYGLCLNCGQPIPLKRLEALPWAEYDVHCEELLEKQNLNREDVYGEPQTF